MYLYLHAHQGWFGHTGRDICSDSWVDFDVWCSELIASPHFAETFSKVSADFSQQSTKWGEAISSDDFPPFSPAAQPVLPISRQPRQNQAEGETEKIKDNPAQLSEQMPRTVDFFASDVHDGGALCPRRRGHRRPVARVDFAEPGPPGGGHLGGRTYMMSAVCGGRGVPQNRQEERGCMNSVCDKGGRGSNNCGRHISIAPCSSCCRRCRSPGSCRSPWRTNSRRQTRSWQGCPWSQRPGRGSAWGRRKAVSALAHLCHAWDLSRQVDWHSRNWL